MLCQAAKDRTPKGFSPVSKAHTGSTPSYGAGLQCRSAFPSPPLGERGWGWACRLRCFPRCLRFLLLNFRIPLSLAVVLWYLRFGASLELGCWCLEFCIRVHPYYYPSTCTQL